MRFLWQTWVAVVAVAMMVGSASGQQIGSYQSILSQAGYANQNTGMMTTPRQGQMVVPPPPGGATGGWQHPQSPMGYPQTGYSNNFAGSYGHNQFQAAPVYASAPMTNQGFGNPMMQTSVQQAQGHTMPATPAPAQAATSHPMPTAPTPVGGMTAKPGAACGQTACGAPMGNVGTTYSMPSPAYTMPPAYGTSYMDYAPMVGCNTTPVYAPSAQFVNNVARNVKGNRNLVGSLFAVAYRRDYEDRKRLAYDWLNNPVFSTDVEHGNMTALGMSVVSRGCNGSGFELRYWGLEEDDQYDVTGPTTSALPGLANLYHVASGADLYTIMNAGDSAQLVRGTEIHNFEANFLRNGGCYTTRSGRCASYELLAGFRLFTFNEDFRLFSNSSVPGYPATLDYNLEADNTLTGFQIGGRSEICLSNKFRLAYGGNVGLFNNYVETRQRITNELGANPTVGLGGPNFDYSDTKNDAAIMGQFDLALIYQLSCRMRVRAGYQALGVSGVALAVDQIPYDFSLPTDIALAQSNGSLLLHGFLLGGELCF